MTRPLENSNHIKSGMLIALLLLSILWPVAAQTEEPIGTRLAAMTPFAVEEHKLASLLEPIPETVLAKREKWRIGEAEKDICEEINGFIEPLGYGLIRADEVRSAYHLKSSGELIRNSLYNIGNFSISLDRRHFIFSAREKTKIGDRRIFIRDGLIEEPRIYGPFYADVYEAPVPFFLGNELLWCDIQIQDRIEVEPYYYKVFVRADKKILYEDKFYQMASAIPVHFKPLGGSWLLEIFDIEKPGRVIIDGEDFGKKAGYWGVWEYRLIRGKPFFFGKKYDGDSFRVFYDGQDYRILYDFVGYDGPWGLGGNDQMVWFKAMKGKDWYYVEAGSFPSAEMFWRVCQPGRLEELRYLIEEENVGVDDRTHGGGMTALMYASCYGNADAAHYLIEKGADVNAADISLETPLIFAAGACSGEGDVEYNLQGKVDVIKLLISSGADVRSQAEEAFIEASAAGNISAGAELFASMTRVLEPKKIEEILAKGIAASAVLQKVDFINWVISLSPSQELQISLANTALNEVAKALSLDVLRLIISLGADVNVRDKEGFTPLMNLWRSFEKVSPDEVRLEMICFLLGKGADINARSINGYTALSLAAVHGSPGEIEILIERGAAMEAADILGRTPLHNAAETYGPDKVKLLISKGAHLNAPDKDGRTPLIMALMSYEENARLLIEAGADLNAADRSGLTPLIYAAVTDSDGIARYLLEKKADPNRKQADGKTALHIISQRNNRAFAVLLIQAGAEVNAIDNDGNTPLMKVPQAYPKPDSGLVEYLLGCGAKLDIVNREGKTAINIAADLHESEIVKELADRGADVNHRGTLGLTPLAVAVTDKDYQLIDFLLERGADPASSDENGHSAWASAFAFIEDRGTLARMVGRLKDVNVKDRASCGSTPLMWAARRGYADIVELILSRRVKIDLGSETGKTALMEAAEKGHANLVSLLLDRGANPNLATQKGWTALMWAAEKGNDDAVALLLKYGAARDKKNNKGETAAMIARKMNHLMTWRMLEAKSE